MQAIQTRYLAPTNHKGGRIVVECAAMRRIYPWNDDDSPAKNHYRSAEKVANYLKWLDTNKLESGCLKNGSWVHVLVAK